MSITNTPEIGKLVVLQGSTTEVFPWPREGGKITKVSGQRVYYTDASGAEKYTHGVAAVCDTQDEVKQFLAFTERNLARVGAFIDLCRAEEHAIWAPADAELVGKAKDTLVQAVVSEGAAAGAKATRAGHPKSPDAPAKPTKAKAGAKVAPKPQPKEAPKEAAQTPQEPVSAKRTRRVRPA